MTDLLRGTRVPTGLGVATVLPDHDFESKSEAGYVWDAQNRKWHGPRGNAKKGLNVVGVAVYATHPSTDVLSYTYNLKDGTGPHLWLPGMPPPRDMHDYLASGGLVEAWNTAFEWWIWNYVCVPRYGWPPLRLEQTRCAMAKARASSYPGALGLAGEVMRLAIQKDKAGDALLKKFSMPRNPTLKDPRTWHTPAEFPQEAQQLYAYNATDIASEAEASLRVPDLEGEELDFWLLDQVINRRGVAVNVPALEDCISIVEQCLTRYNAELAALTGGIVSTELKQLQGWLRGYGVHMESMDEDAIDVMLPKLRATEDVTLNPAIRALELRQLVGSASVKKVFAMRNQLSPWGRLHDLYNYHAARSGRPTGEGPQPTNVPKAGPKIYDCICGRHHAVDACPWCGMPQPPSAKRREWSPEAAADALSIIKYRNVDLLQQAFGDAMLTVSGCLRALYQAAEGCTLICSDFSSIEAVVLAAMTGEEWRMKVFEEKRDIYLESVSRSHGIPMTELIAHKETTGQHHHLRQGGKIQELALGYGGWLGALKSMAEQIGVPLTQSDEELKRDILKWRAASPAVQEWWGGQERRVGHGRRVTEYYGLEGAVIKAIMRPGEWQHVNRLDGTFCGVSYVVYNDALYCRLPSGRYLTYHRPRLIPGERAPWAITFEGYNTNPKMGGMGWVTMYTYGGKICENLCQSIARDIQRRAMLSLERAGYPVVLHVYDEIVCEVPLGQGHSVEQMEAIMSTMPEWATYKGKPWPVRANGGWMRGYYGKS